MTRKEGALLASRAFALYLVCWGLSDVTYVPQTLLSFRHSMLLAAREYSRTYYSVLLTFHVVRIVALFGTAGWLYKCGPGVERFFWGVEDASATNPR